MKVALKQRESFIKKGYTQKADVLEFKSKLVNTKGDAAISEVKIRS